MKTTTKKIGTRELLRNLKTIKAAVKKGHEFTVFDRTTPLFRIVPVTPTADTKYTFADLATLQFSTDEPRLSQQVDKVVYDG